jgi:hypothetical protein
MGGALIGAPWVCTKGGVDLNNNKLLPFEKNRYYPGKLLTSADFVAEQDYETGKRRFLNGLFYGSGVVCGLNVINLDDTTLLVESGVAIDGFGREIVSESSLVRKLGAIEGYDSLKTNEAALWIRYEEEAVQPVFSIGASGSEGVYEMNRLREEGKLFFADDEATDEAGEAGEFFSYALLYEDENFSVRLVVPSVTPVGGDVKLLVSVQKLTQTPLSFSLSGTLETPSFVAADGRKALDIEIPEVVPEPGETVERSFYIHAKEEEDADTLLIVKPEAFRLTVDGETKSLSGNTMLHTAIEKNSPEGIAEREIAKASLEARSMSPGPEAVKLAVISIIRGGQNAIIGGVREIGIKKYVRTFAGNAVRRDYLSWYGSAAVTRSSETAEKHKEEDITPLPMEPVYVTGVLEIPLGIDEKKNKIFYSSEIIHGLGAGDVHVSVGIEYYADDERLGKQAKNTIYGDPSIFDNNDLPIPKADLAVRVMAERGSFIVGAKLRKNTDYVVLLVRWTATHLPFRDEHNIRRQLSSNASITPVHPTIVVAPNESAFIDVRFLNMDPCSLEYETTEKNAGTITPDGIYTASNKEGVHEIHISSSENPFISTYAYVVVKRADPE